MAGAADEPYWTALEQGRLTLQHCASCGTWHWPAVSRCGVCGQWEPGWEEVAPEGKVFSWQTTHHRFQGTEAFDLPYVTVLAALPQAGGRRLLGRFEGDATTLALDAPLTARIGRTGALPVLIWTPARNMEAHA